MVCCCTISSSQFAQSSYCHNWGPVQTYLACTRWYVPRALHGNNCSALCLVWAGLPTPWLWWSKAKRLLAVQLQWLHWYRQHPTASKGRSLGGLVYPPCQAQVPYCYGVSKALLLVDKVASGWILICNRESRATTGHRMMNGRLIPSFAGTPEIWTFTVMWTLHAISNIT